MWTDKTQFTVSNQGKWTSLLDGDENFTHAMAKKDEKIKVNYHNVSPAVLQLQS